MSYRTAALIVGGGLFWFVLACLLAAGWYLASRNLAEERKDRAYWFAKNVIPVEELPKYDRARRNRINERADRRGIAPRPGAPAARVRRANIHSATAARPRAGMVRQSPKKDGRN